MKKVLLVISCLMALLIAAGGCGKGISDNKQSDIITKENNTEGTKNKETSDNGQDNKEHYNYIHELNIIDDNYRNFYEIFVYSFYDSNKDGIGDINGVISKLDYINDGNDKTDTDLGFNGIWLMPIMPSTTYHKYDVTDYCDIDPQYGTMEDFKKLVEECHKRGIDLIIDLVFNHTSAKHPWFLEAVSYLESLEEGQEPDLEECPYAGYYHFTRKYNGSDTYYKAGDSRWYYEGVFWDQMPDLALDNDKVRKEIEDVAKFWLDLGVDGFRLDAAKEYYSGETKKNVEVLQWFTDYVKSVKEDAYIVAEVWEEKSNIAAYYESGIPSLFNFPLAMHNGLIINSVRKLGTSTAKNFGKELLNIYEQYGTGNPEFIDAPFLSNHDTTRISAGCINNEDQMKMSAGVLLTLNGSPYVYYGEEIGMNSMGSKDENKRLPMEWSAVDATGITSPPPGADEVEQKFKPLDEQMKDPRSIYHYYKRAIRIRNENPEIARGEMSIIEELCTKDISAIKKIYEGSEIIILYNMNEEEARVPLKKAGLTNLNIRGYLTVDGREAILSEGMITMPKYSIVVLK